MSHPGGRMVEWQKEAGGKQPWFMTQASREPVSFAALWERWEKGDEPLEPFTILTTAASPALADIHHRQPAIIEPDNFDEWLAPGTAQDRLLAMLLAMVRSAYEGPFDRWPISRRVNSPRNEGPDMVQPLDG